MTRAFALVLALVAAAACGDPDVDRAGPRFSGSYAATFAGGEGRVEILETAAGELLGTLNVAEPIWSFSGEWTSAEEFVLVLLPSRDEELLLATLALQKPATQATESAPAAWYPLHAADKITFAGRVNSGRSAAEGTVSSVFTTEATRFSLRRIP